MVNTRLAVAALVSLGLAAAPTFAQAPQPAPASADGITMDMMPITPEQLKTCRDQTNQQLATEQDTLHKREHGQDNDKMKQGGITAVSGVAASAVSRNRGGWWGYGNNNGAGTAAATGDTQRTNRNSADVASTTAASQTVGVDAYQQCINGIKGPEYINFRRTGQMTAFTPSGPQPAAVAVAAVSKTTVQDEGDGKHVILTMPGADPKELDIVPGSKNAYMDSATGDKYVVLPDGSTTRIPKVKKAATN